MTMGRKRQLDRVPSGPGRKAKRQKDPGQLSLGLKYAVFNWFLSIHKYRPACCLDFIPDVAGTNFRSVGTTGGEFARVR